VGGAPDADADLVLGSLNNEIRHTPGVRGGGISDQGRGREEVDTDEIVQRELDGGRPSVTCHGEQVEVPELHGNLRFTSARVAECVVVAACIAAGAS